MDGLAEISPQIIAALSVLGSAVAAALAFWASNRDRKAAKAERDAGVLVKHGEAWDQLVEGYRERVTSLEATRLADREEIKILKATVKELQRQAVRADLEIRVLSDQRTELLKRVEELETTVNGE